MPPADEQFTQVAKHWDLETLYADLASAKGKRLTPMEKRHLRGLLCGYSPSEIAEKLQKTPKGVETDLCATLYKYVKSLVGKGSAKIENWRNIAEWLEDAGYKTKPPTKFAVKDSLSDNTKFNVTNITFENNQITIDVFLQITVPLPSKLSIQNLDLDNNSN
ncbi:MAG: helix-turn-helix domain-containing protein [Microcoleus sp. PH2017_29_MFU_D_A]|nr:helix-turn-helix domain-containing protein [Microcoleus sp. PH2017_07_MST_O_A]MCC3426347.1 helix-turn-helix domain-containing protein [Microcoleus sp. PH2017_01_SCD_O_A]MCC3457120.1 helix-turn-helix domain-containing protein [Microcoleus sp. PH2017_08_TRC_O_A]MCC3513681.1 helix-turn-helix domain-containing protein [Microcoleus sp. PH2017_17_BER_D_A]MCC3606238.1 helix-turn-helix domain-containing protein [Microcoleus sp. PH2017_29_MFU_D_A]MCC3637278.1 helix-turn-helix domain-containing prote